MEIIFQSAVHGVFHFESAKFCRDGNIQCCYKPPVAAAQSEKLHSKAKLQLQGAFVMM